MVVSGDRAQAVNCGESHLITEEILTTYKKRCSTCSLFSCYYRSQPCAGRDLLSFLWNCIFSGHGFLL